MLKLSLFANLLAIQYLKEKFPNYTIGYSDHTIGNISTFLYRKYNFEIEILTNTGIFHVINNVKNIKKKN